MIYVCVFLLSALLLYCSTRCHGLLACFLAGVSLLLPCLLAGFRDETVGVDVLTYAKWMCINAQSMSLLDFLSYESSIAALGWNVFTWLAVRALGGLPGYLFAIEALCLLPVYFGLKRMSPGGEWAGIFIWLYLEYAFSLNGMRQCVAMGFVFYSVCYVADRRPLPFCIAIAVATLFHQTAIIALLFYPLSWLSVYGDAPIGFFGKWKSFAVSALLALVVAVLFAYGDRIVVLASSLKESYSYQMSHLGARDISYAGLWLLAVSAVALYAVNREKKCSSGRLSGTCEADCAKVSNTDLLLQFALVVSVVGALLWQLDFIANTLGRLGSYGTMLLSLGGGLLCLGNKRYRGTLHFLLLSSLVFFVVVHLVLGHSGVQPYTSAILGIG